MSYNVYLTDGNGAAVVQDGTVNNDYSVSLIGQGVQNYGYILAQNAIHQMENFASYDPPLNPVIGQLWYNKSNGILYVFDADEFFPLDKNVPYLHVDSFTAGDITADTINASVFGNNITANVGNFANLNVSNRLDANLIVANNLVVTGNITAEFTGPIGKYKPDDGYFANLYANSFTGHLYGYFNGVIGNEKPNVAAFTDVTLQNLYGGNINGDFTGSIGQKGFKYPGSFTDVDVTNLVVRNNFEADYITAKKGFIGPILTNSQPYITHLGNLDYLNVNTNINTDTIHANLYYGTIATNAQPYINTLGDLTNLHVLGNTVVNTLYANSINAPFLTGTITTGDQPFITKIGTLNDLKVRNKIDGNLAGTADSALEAGLAYNAYQVISPEQPNITTVGTMANLTVRGPVDLGDITNLQIGGGTPDQFLSINTASHPYWTTIRQVPDPTGHNGEILTNDGVRWYWGNSKATSLTFGGGATLPKGDLPHTAYTIFTVDCTDLQYGEIFVKFLETNEDYWYSGTLGISIFPADQTYCVTPISFSGSATSSIQISSSDGWTGYPTYTDIAAVPIKIYNAGICTEQPYGLILDLANPPVYKTETDKVVINATWSWITKATIETATSAKPNTLYNY